MTKRTSKEEKPKQRSLFLRLRATHFYPNPLIMPISDLEFKAFITCSTKGYLRSVGAGATETEFAEHQLRITNDMAQQFHLVIAKKFAIENCPQNVSFVDAFRHSNAHVLVDCAIATSSMKTTLHGVERVTTKNKVEQ